MITKSENTDENVKYPAESFTLPREYQMKLNPEKCIFGVSLEKFLGFMVSHKGIEANIEKIRAVIEIKLLYTLKKIQSLMGKLVALNRFIIRATDNCHTLLQGKKIKWTPEYEQAFQQLNDYL